MLNHREKRRYVAIMFNDDGEYRPFQLIEKIRIRFKELFGIFQLQSATLKLYDSELGNIMIVGCKLPYIDYFLVSVVLCEPSLTVLCISGTLKRLRRNVSKTDYRNIKNNES
jgi:RNase P/RNase MRP subunit POP5